jgi:hypothetical protein
MKMPQCETDHSAVLISEVKNAWSYATIPPKRGLINHLTPNGRTAHLQMLHFFIYSTNIRTEYFKYAAHSPFFPLQNAVYFIMLPLGSCIIHILYTGCAEI